VKIVDTKALVVDNPANVCLAATNDSAEEYYLYVGTELGITTTVEFGPCVSDFGGLYKKFGVSYNKFDYNDRKINKIINAFVGDLGRNVSNVRIVSVNELREVFPDISKVII